jgi:hypothetical protein
MSFLDNLKKLAFGQGRRNLEELSERLAELPAGQEIVRTVAARTARSPTIRSGCSPAGCDPPGSWPLECSNGGLPTCWSHADHDFYVRRDVADEIRYQSWLSPKLP